MNVDEHLSSTKAGASEAEIEEVERATGYRFGPELRSLLVASNGGVGTRTKLVLPDASTTAGFEYLPTHQMSMQWRRAELTPAHIPFIRDESGNLLVADRRELVSFWDHDVAKLMRLGFRIKDLPSRLQPLPPDPPVDLRELFPLAVPLMNAIQSGGDTSRIIRQQLDVDVVSQFLLLAVSLEAPDLVRTTVAHVNESVICGATEMVDWLLAHGANAHPTDKKGLTAKQLARSAPCPRIGDKLP